jgi:hypothetical protein
LSSWEASRHALEPRAQSPPARQLHCVAEDGGVVRAARGRRRAAAPRGRRRAARRARPAPPRAVRRRARPPPLVLYTVQYM